MLPLIRACASIALLTAGALVGQASGQALNLRKPPEILKLEAQPSTIARPTGLDRFNAHLEITFRAGDAGITGAALVEKPPAGAPTRRTLTAAELGITAKGSSARIKLEFTPEKPPGRYAYSVELIDSRGGVSRAASAAVTLDTDARAPLLLTEMSPSLGRPGDLVVLRGNGFIPPPGGALRVEVGTLEAPVRFHTPGLVGFLIPDGAPTGTVRVISDLGTVHSRVPLLVSTERRSLRHGPLFSHGTSTARTRYQHVNIDAGQSQALQLQYLGPACCSEPGIGSGTFFVCSAPHPTDLQYTDPSASTVEPGRITSHGIVVEYSHPNSLQTGPPVHGLLLPGGLQTVQVVIRAPEGSPSRSYTFGCSVNYYQTQPDGTPTLPYQDEIFLSVNSSQPPPSGTTSVEVLTGPIRGVSAESTFTIRTRWRVPERPHLAATDQRLRGEWNGGASSDRIEHVRTEGPSGSSGSRVQSFPPGVTELQHTFQVKDRVRPGTVDIEFELHDHIDHRSVRASAPVEISGPDVEGRVVTRPPTTVLPNQTFGMATEWVVPSWVDDPKVAFRVNSPDITLEQTCVGETCYPRSTVAVADGTVRTSARFRVSNRQFPARMPTSIDAVIFEKNRSNDPLKILGVPLTLASEPRIDLGGDAFPCGDDWCVHFQKVRPGYALRKTATLINRGSEDLTFSVSGARSPFARSQSPGGTLGAIERAGLPGLYYNDLDFFLEFAAPAEDRLAEECEPEGAGFLCEGAIEIASNDPTRSSLRVRLLGHADPSPKLAIEGDVDDGVVDFGLVPVGETAERTIQIVNKGGQILEGFLPPPLPANPGGLAFRADARAFHLGAGQSKRVAISAAPTADGLHRSTLRVTADEGAGTIARDLALEVITGPKLLVFDRGALRAGPDGRELNDNDAIDLGFISLGSESHPVAGRPDQWAAARPVLRTLLLRNDTRRSGDPDIDLELILPSSLPEWTFEGAEGERPTSLKLKVPAGQNALVNLRFDPAAERKSNVTLLILSTAANHPSPLSIDLRADAVRPAGKAEIELQTRNDPTDPLLVGFGRVPLRQQAGATISVRNGGIPQSSVRIEAELTDVAAPSGASDPFSLQALSGASFPLILGAEEGDVLDVGFRPSELGEYSGSVTIRTNDETLEERTYALRGEGVRYPVPPILIPPEPAEPLGLLNALGQSWHQFDLAMRQFLGTPLAANWATYAKHLTWHSAREHRHMRAVDRLLALFAHVGDQRLLSCISNVSLLPQPPPDPPAYCRGTFETFAPSQQEWPRFAALAGVLAQFETLDSMVSQPVWRAVVEETQIPSPSTTTDPRLRDGRIAFRVWDDWVRTLARVYALSERMITAEVEAYRLIASAYVSFLEAANSDPSGIPPALTLPGDVSGLLSTAMSLYAEARRLGDQASTSPNPGDVIEQRLGAIRRANELLALQHQMVFQAALYDPLTTDFALAPAFTFLSPAGPTLFTQNWADFATRLAIDPALAPPTPYGITAANAPSLQATAGTLGWYLDRFLIDPALHENPALVPLPGGAALRWSAPPPPDVQAYLTIFNSAMHVYGAAAVQLHLPLPDEPLGINVGTVAEAVARVAGICAAIELAGWGIDNAGLHHFGEACSLIFAGIAAGLGEPLAMLTAGILLLKGMVDLGTAIVEAQAVLPCWPNCTAPLQLAEWIYR